MNLVIINKDEFNQDWNDLCDELAEKEEEIERLNNIIREAREYIEHENFKRNILVGVSTKKYTRDILNNILEILDKASDD